VQWVSAVVNRRAVLPRRGLSLTQHRE